MADNVFDSLSVGETDGVSEVASVDAVTNGKEAAKKAEQKERAKKLISAMNETINQDPTIIERLGAEKDDLEVINSLGFGNSGNVVLDKSSAERKLIPTSTCIGYRLRNAGSKDITYYTEEYTKDADGKYVGNKVEKVLHPGEVVDLTRKYLAMLASRVEYSFGFKNGSMRMSSGVFKTNDLDAMLSCNYFVFDKDSGMEVNDDSVKLNIGEKDADGKWHVKPEFTTTFGYLENVKEHAKRATGTSRKYSTSDASANWIRKMLEQQGV